MKRTKTFVMKFLSVFILGAAVLATSCTKDLEDRMDKVEETLATVVKNTADLEAALKALPNISGVSLTSEKVNGNYVLTFKVPGKADQVINIDIPADTNDAANVTVTPDTPVKGYTRVTIKTPTGDKTFDYLTTIPSNISSIVTLSKDHRATAGTDFTVSFFFNTSDGKKIDGLVKDNISVIMSSVTKASSIVVSENVVVKTIAPTVGGKQGEFDVTFTTKKDYLADSSYRIGVTQTANTVYSEPFSVKVGPAPILANIYAGDVLADATPSNLPAHKFELGIATNVAGQALATPCVARLNNVDSKIVKGREYFVSTNVTTPNPIASYLVGAASISNKTYEIYKVEGGATEFNNNLLTVIGEGTTNQNFSVNCTKEVYDAISKKISDEAAKTTSRLVPAAGIITITPEAAGVIAISADFDKIADGESFYYIVTKGQIAGGNYFIVGSIVGVNKGNGLVYTPVTGASDLNAVVATDLTNVLKTDRLTYLTKTYNELTGRTDITGTRTYVDIYDGPKKINTSAIMAVNPIIGSLNKFEYAFNLGIDLQLEAGKIYNVVVKHIYSAVGAPEKFFTISHDVKVSKPTLAVAAKTTLGDGYKFAGDLISLESYKVFAGSNATAKAEQTLVSFATGSKFDATQAIAITYKNGATAVDAANYCTYLRVKTTNDAGQSVYFDKLDVDNTKLPFVAQAGILTNIYTVAATEKTDGVSAADNRLALDKEYTFEVVVVYADGNREVKTYKAQYQSAMINGFTLSDEAATITETFSGEISAATGSLNSVLDLSYVGGENKPYFFSTNKGTTAIWNSEIKPVAGKFIKMVASINYVVNPLAATEKAKIKNGTVELTTTEATNLISLIGFGALDNKVQTATVLQNDRTSGELELNNATATTTGLKPSYVLTADVNQTITVTVVDYYGRSVTKTINITIKK